MEDKKHYIYNNIKKNNVDHSYIIPYIKNKNVPFSENINGIFINISILEDNIIEELYNIIFNFINNKVNHEREKKFIEIHKDINNNNNNNNNIITNIIKKNYKEIEDINNIQLFILKNIKNII